MKKGNVEREESIELNLKITWVPRESHLNSTWVPCESHLNSTWDPREQYAGPMWDPREQCAGPWDPREQCTGPTWGQNSREASNSWPDSIVLNKVPFLKICFLFLKIYCKPVSTYWFYDLKHKTKIFTML